MTTFFDPKPIAPSDSDGLPSLHNDEFLPPISRWVRFGGVAIVAIIITGLGFTSVMKYKVTVKAQASLRPVGEVRLVQAATEGSVVEIVAKENQSIALGDVIATIDDSRLQTRKSQLQSSIQQAQLQLGQIRAQIESQKLLAIAESEEAAADLRATEAARNTAQARRDRYLPIAQAGALSKNDLEEAQLAAEQQAQAVAAAQARVQRAQAAVAKEQKTLTQQQIELSKQLEQSTFELRQVETDLRQTTIAATSDGVISKLNLRNSGQTVSAGQEIAQIVPSHAPLQIKAILSPNDIDKVKPGQTAQMRVSACPYPDFGILNGKVVSISQDTIKPSSSETAKPTPAFYEATITPNGRSIGRGQHQCTIQAGMEGQVDIVSREETVLQFFLRKARLLTDL
jgi:multidrug efflux pump subunit AcrA (membrane-fusion protein)